MSRKMSFFIFLSTIMAIALPCLGFTTERLENVTSSSSSNSSILIDVGRVSNEKMETTTKEQSVYTSEIKKSRKIVDQTSSSEMTPERKFHFTFENVEKDPRFIKKNYSNILANIESVAASTPRAIITIFTDHGQGLEDFLKEDKIYSFAAEGSLQSCNSVEVEGSRYSLDDILVSGNKMKKQDCERMLKSNIASLLLWARDIKGMTIGTFSNTNFTIPSIFGYEKSVKFSKEFEDIDVNNMNPKSHGSKPIIHGNWHTIDLGKSGSKDSLNTQDEETDEAGWNVFDMFSKIRLVLFRSLLESLSGNIPTSDHSIPSRKSHLLRPNLIDVIEELKSVGNEKGFILIASVPASELNSVFYNLLRDTYRDTLLVGSGLCPHDGKSVPFFAQGPSAKMILEARTIWDIPTIIRNIITVGCQDSKCRNRRHIFQPMPLVPHNTAAFKSFAQEIAEKSKIGNILDTSAKEEIKKVADSNTKEDVKTVADSSSKEEAQKNGEKETKSAASNSAEFNEKFLGIFGIASSMIIAYNLAS